jgi:hypothetical protein
MNVIYNFYVMPLLGSPENSHCRKLSLFATKDEKRYNIWEQAFL